MENHGHFTRQEIDSQPQAWASALEVLEANRTNLREFLTNNSFEDFLFTGCGSTYYLSLSAAVHFQYWTEIPARALPASEIWLRKKGYLSRGKTLLVAISRSGETSETIYACKKFREQKSGKILTLTCYPEMPLAKMGDFNLILPSGQEQSIAQTRAFTTLQLAATWVTFLKAGRNDLLAGMKELPAVCERILKQYSPLASELGMDKKFDRFYFLGSGNRYGLACEMNLKMKEMSLSFSESFHFLEFRHGPKSMVTDTTLIVGLLSEHEEKEERKVLDEMRARGATVISLGERNCNVHFDSNVSSAIRNVLYLPFGQKLAFNHALLKGLDPDRPFSLDAVVKLEG
jgi:glucosamine--fructose-6-phosphate aminotransferase (isomerizing)